MKKTGTLEVNSGVSQLDGTRLARAAAGDPFAAATNFLANRGLDDGDFIFVTGTEGVIGSVSVIFISEAGPAPAISTARIATNIGGEASISEARIENRAINANPSRGIRVGSKKAKKAIKKSGNTPARKESRKGK